MPQGWNYAKNVDNRGIRGAGRALNRLTMSETRRRSFLIPLAYFVMTLVMTYPVILHLTTAIPGDGFDGWQNYWNLWWIKQALLDLGQFPYFTTFLDYPAGVSLYFHTLNPFNGLWALPVQLAGGLVLAYNAVVLFSFTVGGVGAYLLARYVLRNVTRALWPAVLAGIVFTFSPFHFAHLLGHMQVFSLEWLPFYVLYLLRTVEADATRGQRLFCGAQRWNAAWMSLFMVLVGLCDWYYLMYLVLFTGLYLLYVMVTRRLRASAFVAVIVGGGLAGLVLLPLWLPMVLEVQRANYMRPDPAHVLRLSADLLAYVTPNELHPLWGELTRQLSERFTTTTSERLIFAGFVPLGLAVYALLRSRCKARWFWASSTLFFGVLSLGPVLHVAGQSELPFVGTVVLPYGWLNRLVPFMDISRSVSRLDVMVMLSLGVLAGMGLAALLRDTNAAGRKANALGGILALAICFEFLAIPYPLSPPDTPSFYFTLAADREDYAVLNLPLDWDRPNYLLYQTVHGKRLTSAYTSRDNPLSLVDRTPFLQELRRPGMPHVVQGNPEDTALSVLDAFAIRYVVVDLYQMPEEEQRRATLALTERAFGARQPVYRDERLIVYEVEPHASAVPFVRLGGGWTQEQVVAGEAQRLVAGAAEVVVHSPAARNVTLQLRLRCVADCSVTISGAGDTPGRYDLGSGVTELDIPLRVEPGDNLLVLSGAAGEPVALLAVAIAD